MIDHRTRTGTMHRRVTLAITVAGLAVVLGCTATAHAAFNKAEQKCRFAIAKSLGKLAKTADKVGAKCHKLRDKGKIPSSVPCNDFGDPRVDAKGKVIKAQDKLRDQIAKKCVDKGIDDDVLHQFTSCPAPCDALPDVSNPLASYAELGDCLACYGTSVIEQKNQQTLGLPSLPLPSKDEEKCHAALAKDYAKHLQKILKERVKCQKDADKSGIDDIALSGCDSADPRGKIAKSLSKARLKTMKKCWDVDFASLDSCAASDLTAIQDCVAAATDAAADALFPASYQLASTLCPVAVSTLIRAGDGLSGHTRSFLDIGWTGLAHGVDVVDQYTLTGDVSCPGSQPPTCGACTVDGVSPLGDQFQAFTRCSGTIAGVDDPSIECNEPFTLDPACNGAMCTHYLGPPLPISAGNNPTCSLNALADDISGTVDPDAGSSELTVNLRTRTYTGGTATLTRPCPVCLGDATGRDGQRDGTCSGGSNDGNPCDVQGFDATFAPSPDEGLSLDCPPAPLTNITGDGLSIHLGFTTGSTSLPFQVACDSPLQSLDCACGVCTGDTSYPCENNGDCAAISAGSCSSVGSGVARQPNDCDTLTCLDQGGDKGLCDVGPDDKFCDGMVRANGDGFLQCDDDSSCVAINPVCPGNDCGRCSIVERRKCFLDPIEETGVADPDNPVLVTTFCLPPTTNAAINGTAGTPGPGRAVIDAGVELLY